MYINLLFNQCRPKTYNVGFEHDKKYNRVAYIIRRQNKGIAEIPHLLESL